MNPKCGKIGIFKRAWNEIPELVGAKFMALVGVALTITALHIYDEKGGDNRKYKFQYTVVRDDDPMAKHVHPREEESEEEECDQYNLITNMRDMFFHKD